jgi:hypothetical protein
MRLALFTLMSIVCAVAYSATVYKWVDENGVTHYSDQPHENAEKVHVAAPQTYKATPVPARAGGPNGPAPEPQQQPNDYQSCEITSPTNNETLPNAFSVNAAVQVSPTPHDGDQLLLLLDGNPVPNFPSGGGSLTIAPIERGSHSMQAIVQDSKGRTLCQSSNVSFTILQPSVLNPANPNFRH